MTALEQKVKEVLADKFDDVKGKVDDVRVAVTNHVEGAERRLEARVDRMKRTWLFSVAMFFAGFILGAAFCAWQAVG